MMVPVVKKWKQDLYGKGTWVARYNGEMGERSHEVFCGGSDRGKDYVDGWYARSWSDQNQYNLAKRTNGEWGGTYDYDNEMHRFETAEEAMKAVKEWWDSPQTGSRVLHGDYIKTNWKKPK